MGDVWPEIIGKTRGLASLGDDWDGQGAAAPPDEIVEAALRLLSRLRSSAPAAPPIRVAPTPCGTICLEWQEPGLYTEAEIAGPSLAEWMRVASDGDPEHWEEAL